jgi:DNA sulfur modification protein DndD
LYGHRTQKTAYEYFNTISREETSPVMSVRIDLADEDKNISVVRKIQCNSPVRSVKDLSTMELLFFENQAKRQAQDTQVLQELVNEILPFEASQFSFFDGERIEVYSSDQATDATKSAISSVLGLTLLTQAKEDAEKLIYEIDKDRRRLLEREGKGSTIAQNMKDIDREIEDAKSQKSELEEAIKSLASQEFDLHQQLSAQDSAKNLIEDIKKSKNKLDELDKQKSLLTIDLKNATRLLYLDILEPVIEKEREISQKRHQGIMSIHFDAVRNDVSREVLKSIEETGVCICGRKADSTHLNEIKQILKYQDSKINSDDSAYGLGFLSSLIETFDAALSSRHQSLSYGEISAKLANLENDIDEITTSIASKENLLMGSDEEAIETLSKLLDKVRKDKSQAEREVGSLQKTLEDLANRKRQLEKEISQISGQVQGLDLLTTQVALLNKSADAFGEIVDRVSKAKQQDIQDASSKYFRKITNKIHAYERMIINPDFSFGVETAHNTRPPMELISAGEKQVTALSFILGLSEYTRRKAPIFMDTPMGRLDETHRRNVAKVLLELANSGQQIILLVTDTDIAFGVYDILRPAIGAEFDIVYNQTNLTSNIVRRV